MTSRSFVRIVWKMVLSVSILTFYCSVPIHSKEIVATKEWQLLGEGDTIPKGLHVRVDFETGRKWVKLLDDDEDSDSDNVSDDAGKTSCIVQQDGTCIPIQYKDDKNEKNDNKSVSSSLGLTNTNTNTDTDIQPKNKDGKVQMTRLSNTKVSPEASAKITDQLLTQNRNKLESIAQLNDFRAGDNHLHEADVDTMYRALLSLPEEEKARMGGLPPKPTDSTRDDAIHNNNNNNNDGGTKARWEEFDSAVRKIWNARQAQLKELEEQHMADMPSILQEHIDYLKLYVSSPLEHVVAIADRYPDDEDIDDGDEDGIIWVLNELEFLLMDVDMARDFHTMGGWPLLVSLTTDGIHGLPLLLPNNLGEGGNDMEITIGNNVTNNNDGDGDDINNTNNTNNLKKYKYDKLRQVVWIVQKLAARSIGNSVKHIEEFRSWALEDFSDVLLTNDRHNNKGDEDRTNVLTILLSKLEESSSKTITAEDRWDDSHYVKKISSDLYALGALLRGNRIAIHRFTSMDGQNKIYSMLDSMLDYVDRSTTKKIDRFTEKALYRTMHLVEDIVTDVRLHPDDGGREADERTLSSFTTGEWCKIPLEILARRKLTSPSKRDVVDAMVAMVHYCKGVYDDENASKVEDRVTMAKESLDSDDRDKLVAVMEALRRK